MKNAINLQRIYLECIVRDFRGIRFHWASKRVWERRTQPHTSRFTAEVPNQPYLLVCRQAMVCSCVWVENFSFSWRVAFVRECCSNSCLDYYSRNAIDSHLLILKCIVEAVFSSLDFASLLHRNRIVRECCVWMNARSEEKKKKTGMPSEWAHWVEQKEKELKELREKISKKKKKKQFFNPIYTIRRYWFVFCAFQKTHHRIGFTHHFRFKFELFCRLRILCSVLLCQQKKTRHRLCAFQSVRVRGVHTTVRYREAQERGRERKNIENANLNCFFWEVSVCWVFFFFCYCLVSCTENKTNYERNNENK